MFDLNFSIHFSHQLNILLNTYLRHCLNQTITICVSPVSVPVMLKLNPCTMVEGTENTNGKTLLRKKMRVLR